MAVLKVVMKHTKERSQPGQDAHDLERPPHASYHHLRPLGGLAPAGQQKMTTTAGLLPF